MSSAGSCDSRKKEDSTFSRVITVTYVYLAMEISTFSTLKQRTYLAKNLHTHINTNLLLHAANKNVNCILYVLRCMYVVGAGGHEKSSFSWATSK